MKKQIFITSRGQLNLRWKEAFDSASYCDQADFLDHQFLSENTVFWLDVSQLRIVDRQAIIQKVALKVKKLVVMTDEQTVSEAFQVMQSGAVGYCHYLAVPEQLREISSVVYQGGLWLGGQLMQTLLSALPQARMRLNQNKKDLDEKLKELTPRERMVAIEIGKASTNKEIATKFEITERTVKAHVSVIFTKLGVNDRVKLALFVNNAR